MKCSMTLASTNWLSKSSTFPAIHPLHLHTVPYGPTLRQGTHTTHTAISLNPSVPYLKN